MAKYYKYMKIRNNFFDNLLIRASQPTALDGHFECIMTVEQIKEINKHQNSFFQGKNELHDELSDYDAEEFLGIWQQEFAEKGIISLTKDNSNIAMWQNYADKYQGMCIEFETDYSILSDISSETNTRFKEAVLGDYYEIPVEVAYAEHIPNFKNQEDAVPSKKDEYPHKKITRRITLTKPKGLSYEEEYRILLQLQDADKMSFEADDHFLPYIKKHCKRNDKIELITTKMANGKYHCEITFPPRFELDEEVGDESIKFEILRLTYHEFSSEPLFLFKLDPKVIKTVYLGYRAESSKIKQVVDSIKNNRNLQHVKIKVAKPSQSDFKMIFSDYND